MSLCSNCNLHPACIDGLCTVCARSHAEEAMHNADTPHRSWCEMSQPAPPEGLRARICSCIDAEPDGFSDDSDGYARSDPEQQ